MNSDYSAFTKTIIRDYQKYSKIVNEENNLGCMFYILQSKDYKMNLRLHALIQNLSGAGKSTLADAAIKPFKEVCPEDVIEVSRFTGPSLQRFGNFDGKILYHNQAFGDESNTVLPLLSDGSIGLMVAEKVENSPKFETKLYNLRGMPSFITTTITQLNAQMLRRVILRTVDESSEQTRAITQAQARRFMDLDPASIKEFLTVCRIIKQVRESDLSNKLDKVIIPYADRLEQKLPDNLEMRSNFPKFEKLIASVCLVKSACYRGFYDIEPEVEPPLKKGVTRRVAIATVEDFNDAYKMAGKGFFQPLSAAQSAMLDYLGKQIQTEEKLDRESYAKVRTSNLMAALKWSKPQVHKIAKALSDMGLIQKEEIEESGRKYSEMQFIKPSLEIGDLDPGESSPEAWLKGRSYSEVKIEDSFVCL